MKMVVGATVVAILIVCGAYFGSHWYYGDDPVPLIVDSQFARVSVGTSTVDDSEVDKPTFGDESDNGIAESPEAMGHSHGDSTHSHDTQVMDEPSQEAWNWDEELREDVHEESITNLSDGELRERFLASVESGKFARKLREYFERQHGKGPEVDVLVRYHEKLVRGQAMLSDAIAFDKARRTLGIAGAHNAKDVDMAIKHLKKL